MRPTCAFAKRASRKPAHVNSAGWEAVESEAEARDVDWAIDDRGLLLPCARVYQYGAVFLWGMRIGAEPDKRGAPLT